MKKNVKKDRGMRLLRMYIRLNKGEILNKNSMAEEYGVSTKTIQRDILYLRKFLSEEDDKKTLIFNKHCDGYMLTELITQLR